MTKDIFIKEIISYYGDYTNKNHLIMIYKYIDKYLDDTRLEEILWFIILYYSSKTNPPIVGDIDFSIRQAIKDNRGNDPFKKQIFANQYEYSFKKITEPIQKEKLTEMFGGLAKRFKNMCSKKKELDKSKNNIDDDDIFHK